MQPPFQSFRNFRGLAALAVTIAAAFVLVTHWRTGAAVEAASAPKPPLDVRSVEVEVQHGYTVEEAFSGRIVSRRESRIGFPLGGRLYQVLVQEGDRVEPDAVLARLDTAKLRAARRELEAQVAEIEARLELARLTAQRTRKLAGRDSISEQKYDEARIEEIALRARLDAARAGLDGIDVDLEYSELHAPYAGSITQRFVDEGTILAPGHEVLRIIENGVMEARFGLSPAAVRQLEIGRMYAIDVGELDVRATLRAVLDDIARETRTVTAVFEIASPPRGVRHGALARLRIPTRHEAEGFWLPIEGLAESRRGLWSAYALVPEATHPDLYRVERRELQLIHTDSDRAYLRGTLRDGERVAATGLHRLVPGQRVSLVDERRATAPPAPR